MRRLRLTGVSASVIALCATILAFGTDPAAAAPGSENNTTTTVAAPPVTIDAETGTPDLPVGGSGGGDDSGETVATTVVIPCRWHDVPTDQPHVDAINTVSTIIEEVVAPLIPFFDFVAKTYYERFGVLHRWGDANGQWEKQQEADCSGATHPGGVVTGDRRWVTSVPPDPATLRPGSSRRVTEIVAPPVAAINPAGPGYAQLGMWLAIEPAGPYVARAQIPAAGPAAVWAETTATLAETTFDFGTGASVTCAGVGTPIPESATHDVREGPCGHTFTDFVGDTTVTITTRWRVTWQLSDGRSGAENDLVLSATIPYEVREIQTVGVGTERP